MGDYQIHYRLYRRRETEAWKIYQNTIRRNQNIPIQRRESNTKR